MASVMFTIPSAGRYGATTKIPLSTFVQAESDWAADPEMDSRVRCPQRRRSGGQLMNLEHFPELAVNPPEHDAECREGDQH